MSRRGRFWQRGASTTEALVVAGAVSLASMAAYNNFGSSVSSKISCLGDQLVGNGGDCGKDGLKQALGEPSVGAAPGTGISQNPLCGAEQYVNEYSTARNAANSKPEGSWERQMLDKIANQPQGVWLGSWSGNGNVGAAVSDIYNSANGKTPIFVAYNIPNRDASGGFSAGGAKNKDEYLAWINSMSQAIGDKKGALILEPDALADLDGLKDQWAREERLAMMREATEIFKRNNPNLGVYLDAGHDGWGDPNVIGDHLKQAGIDNTRGFALNVSNYGTTQANTDWGNQISQAAGGKNFVIDTSRNGNGPSGTDWCNPSGRALGEKPGGTCGGGALDGYVWAKAPGESDGECGRGNPAAGAFSESIAKELAANAHW